MPNKLLHRLLISLVCLTLLALYAHAHWMNRTLRLSEISGVTVSAVDDRPAGGKSIATLTKNNTATTLQCEIIAAYAWPFCEIDFRFSNDDSGIDLSRFDSMELTLKVNGETPTRAVRVFLRNYDPAYSKPGISSTLKPHEIMFDPSREKARVKFRLAQFMVSTWWAQEHPTRPELLGPQLNHVTTIGFATAGNVQPGHYEITVEEAQLHGHWISSENFRLMIILVWIICILAYLMLEWKKSRNILSETDKQRSDLLSFNAELEMKVEERTKALTSSNLKLIETMHKLNHTRDELVQSEKTAALSSLVAGIAHELNTPLGNSILMASTINDSAKTLQEQDSSAISIEQYQEFTSEILFATTLLNRNLSRAGELINNFKQLALDQHADQRRQFSLNEIANDSIATMAQQLRSTGHTIEFTAEQDISMDSYPAAISKILLHIINNAMIHGFEGLDQGEMLLHVEIHHNNYARISFSDNGVGMPPKVLRRVFEPFFTTKMGSGSNGLGMHLVYNMVTQLLGGQIEIKSVIGHGTSIIIDLPLQAPVSASDCARIGAPADVIDDFARFLNGRDILSITSFEGAQSRRDVVEITLFMREMMLLLPHTEIELIAVDSYALGIQDLISGKLSALATTCWLMDLHTYDGDIIISDAMIANGEFKVGMYTREANTRALQLSSIDQLKHLSVVSNCDWSTDWHTLANLGVTNCLDVKTWREMVYLVSSGEADILLAPFPSNEDLNLIFEDCILVPIPDYSLALEGSRHFACSKSKVGQLIAETIYPALNQMRQEGSLRNAYFECGFFNQKTKDWICIQVPIDL